MVMSALYLFSFVIWVLDCALFGAVAVCYLRDRKGGRNYCGNRKQEWAAGLLSIGTWPFQLGSNRSISHFAPLQSYVDFGRR